MVACAVVNRCGDGGRRLLKPELILLRELVCCVCRFGFFSHWNLRCTLMRSGGALRCLFSFVVASTVSAFFLFPESSLMAMDSCA